MIDTISITVAISTLNRPDGLIRCLDALLAGHVLPSEILIVDQSRDDRTQRLVADLPHTPVPVFYHHQLRRGLSASRNLALENTRSTILAVTDDDCVPDDNWVASIQRAFLSFGEVDAVSGRVLPLHPPVSGLYAVSSRTRSSRATFKGRIAPWQVGTGGNFSARTDLLRASGGFDERLGAGSPGKAAEEMDLFYRLLRSGAVFVYEPDMLVYHELQTREKRIATRWTYGFGIGAFCGLWLRERDGFAVHMLSAWTIQQSRELIRYAAHRNWTQVHEKVLMIGGTLSGLTYGLRGGHTLP